LLFDADSLTSPNLNADFVPYSGIKQINQSTKVDSKLPYRTLDNTKPLRLNDKSAETDELIDDLNNQLQSIK
jgi:hypothetical protein